MRFNSPFMNFMNTAAQLTALNFCFLLCCIPIITIGPALAALYQVMLREARGEHGYIIKNYWKHFLQMFWRGIVTFIFFTAIIIFMIFGGFFWLRMNNDISPVIAAVIGLLSCVFLSGMIYSFPLMARFDNSVWQNIKNALCISLTNIKLTFILLSLHATVLGLFYIFPVFRMFMLLIGFAFFAYAFAYIFTRLFKKYEPDEI